MIDELFTKENREKKLGKEMNRDHDQTMLDEEGGKLFIDLYKNNYDTLLGFIANSQDCRNAMTAEDIVHDTFCEAIYKMNTLKEHPNPGGWLMETAKYKLLAEKRRACSRDVGYEDCELEPSKADKKYEEAELDILMEGELDEHEIKLLQLYYNYGYTAKEIAMMENITDGNFKVRMCRLKKKLLKNVDGICISVLFICLHWMQIRL